MTGLLPTNPAWAGKIPLSPPLPASGRKKIPKGEGFYLPFAKGGGEGFRKGIF